MGLALSAAACHTYFAPNPSQVRVTFPSVAPDDRPLALYSGERNAACVQFHAGVGTTSPDVVFTGLAWNSACDAEIDVFAPRFGAFARAVSASDVTGVMWIQNALSSGKLSIPLAPSLALPVRFWMVVDVSTRTKAEELRDRQVQSALSIFSELGTGFELDTSSVAIDSSALEPDCRKSSGITSSPAIYDAAKLNVYYVRNYKHQPHSSYAINCWMQKFPQIIFISWDNDENPDVALAHEIGHALGLVHPKSGSATEIGGGHTDAVPDFPSHNLMESGGATVTNISIGQLYAMNFGHDSWINRPSSPLARPVVRPCQDSWGAGLCVALNRFQIGWPVP